MNALGCIGIWAGLILIGLGAFYAGMIVAAILVTASKGHDDDA